MAREEDQYPDEAQLALDARALMQHGMGIGSRVHHVANAVFSGVIIGVCSNKYLPEAYGFFVRWDDHVPFAPHSASYDPDRLVLVKEKDDDTKR